MCDVHSDKEIPIMILGRVRVLLMAVLQESRMRNSFFVFLLPSVSYGEAADNF